MSTFLTALFTILFFLLAFILIGLYLMSRLVGGFGNLKALYRLFTGKGKGNTRQRSAKSSGKSSRSYNNKSKKTESKAQTDGKMFGQNEGTYVEFEEVKE